MKYLGVDYYPEQWGLDLLEEDLNNIVDLGANLIRIGDFAWTVFEPQDGVYSFEFFDKVIEKAKEKNLKIMMCIPSATMPAWLYKKYPEIMSEDEQGYRQPFGGRRGYCYNSDIYLKKVLDLTYAIAEHYKDCDSIVAYQIDNEIGHEGSDICYCESCHKKFTDYLKKKFVTIENLNDRIGSVFWSQTYNDFDEVPIPKKCFQAQNPSLRLEWERFRSVSIVDFLKAMADTIRSVDDSKEITHDFSGGTINKHFCPHDICEHLDFVSYNNYPVWGGQATPLSEVELAFNLDFVRGFKKQNFCITESIIGSQGHDYIGYSPRPYEASKWAKQSIEHGGESLIFFRYRQFTKGIEQFCQGILDADNKKRRKYQEAKEFFYEVKDVMPDAFDAEVCLVYDYDSKSIMTQQRQSDGFDYEKESIKLYSQFYKRHIKCAVINSKENLERYKIVVLPYMIVMDDGFKNKLKEYVKNGGIAVLTPRTAWKDEDNNLIFNELLPAELNDLIGGHIEESESLLADAKRECSINGQSGSGNIFAEYIEKDEAVELVKWHDTSFGEYSACTKNHYGLGVCYYLGSSFDEEILDKIFDDICQ